MRIKKFEYYVCDFETTVYEGQDATEVWAAACVPLYSEDVQLFHSIDEQFEFFAKQKANIVGFYHNLKFDGSFWLDYLISKLDYQQAYEQLGDSQTDIKWLKDKDMPNKSFKYSISDRGQWYNIIIRVNNHYIELRDSLKLLPFSVKRIGESFKTKHKKLEMEYTGFRYAGCEITPEEQEYIKNDVLVVKEALEFMFGEGHNKLTIGACCLSEYKKIQGKEQYEAMFPDLYEYSLNEDLYGTDNAGDYIRRSYKGGWCYLVKGKANKIYRGGTTADVNSLYPSVMHSESGNKYPIGKPHFWKSNEIPEQAIGEHKYYFVRIKTRFYLKPGKLPFIQIKGSWLYKGTEALESSDVYDKESKSYSAYYHDFDGEIKDTRVELTLTMTDYKLFLEHYNVVDFEILDGCWFGAVSGLFDDYIDKYKKIKVVSKGAMRELAKLFLNNLYGKMASSKDSSFKVAYLRDDNAIGFYPVSEFDKKPGYIPVGSAITSYARNFTIRAAQANYHGVDKPGFIYADTDSIHCDLPPDKITGIKVHASDFCCWKLESCWDIAIFTRQKTYIEHVTHEDLEPIENPYYNVKCAGMPQKCKDLFLLSMDGYKPKETDNFSDEELEFLKTKRQLSDFKVGLKVPGKLRPKRIKGGTLLVTTYYEMR